MKLKIKAFFVRVKAFFHKLNFPNRSIFKFIRQNVFESGDAGRYRLDTTRIGQLFGLAGYAFVMIFVAWIVTSLVEDKNAFTSIQITDYLKLLGGLSALSTLFLLFYRWKKSKP